MIALLQSQMGFIPFQRRRKDLSERDQAKRRRDEGDAGLGSKAQRTEQRSKKREVSPKAFQLEAVPILQMGSGERKFGGDRERIVDGSAVDEEEKVYLLAWMSFNEHRREWNEI